jgi:hypothetical protein
MTPELQRAGRLLQLIGMIFLSPLPAHAHHCSSLSDCWSTATAAAAAAVGAAVLVVVAVLFRWITGVPRSPRLSPPKSREKRIRNSCRIG